MNAFLVITQDKKLLDAYINKLQKQKNDLLIYIDPKTQNYSIDQIKEIKNELTFSQPYHRWYILENFHHSSIEAQNAFLKSLEESPPNVYFILSAPSIYSLLPTIVSRTKIVFLNSKSISKISSVQNIIQFNDPIALVSTKEQALELLLQMISYFRINLVKDKNSITILHHILKMKSLLENNNLNPQLTIDNVLIFIKKQYNIKIEQ